MIAEAVISQSVLPTLLTLPTRSKKKNLITGEEFFWMNEVEQAELVKGEIVHMPPPGYIHAFTEHNFSRIVGNHVRQHTGFVVQRKLGHVMVGEGGVYTKRKPDTVRGIDVAFISHERLAQVKSQTYLDVAPELIVEVLSPNDRWSNMTDKLEEYFAIGVKLVWVADPRKTYIYVYRSPAQVERLTANDELSGGDVLPNFRVPVAEFFE